MNKSAENKKRVFLTGSLSSLTACVMLQPFDVIKTRIQEAPQRISLLEAISSMRSIESLWRGLSKLRFAKL